MTKGSMTVEIPIRRPSGDVGRATLLIGPASQLFSETEDSDADEILDDELVERFTRESERLGVSRPVAEEGAEGASHHDAEMTRFDDQDENW
ncbi:hypothetical protein Q0F99_08870 [Rathayibacter oskolensis]|uniref:hypothetical protein n=1 Tax=Rathayibacter oskolensis TaxID=1891671 RepID=UPI0026600191|nr:hypothetical protein [Rathayibacter oskolensis]WKK72960.1 hypothetical protein Q0F99_08870 [Rathayibacter oskolensis]